MAATGKFRALTSNAALDRPEIIIEPTLGAAGRTWASPRRRSPRRCAWRRSATSTRIWPNSPSATGRFRSASSLSARSAWRPGNVAARCRSRQPRHLGAAVARLPKSASARARPDQPLQPRAPHRHRRRHGAAAPKSARASSWSTNCRRSRTCLPVCACSRPATPKSWARFSTRFAKAMIIGLMLVFVVLILLFGSIFHSFTILMSLPLSIGGVVAALWLTDNCDLHAGGDRHPDADGHRDQERHHAGRFCRRAGEAGHDAQPRRSLMPAASAPARLS